MKKLIVFVILMMLPISSGFLQANPADINNSRAVDAADLAIFTAAWLSNSTPTANWNPACDISDSPDGVVNELDFAVLAANWLWSAPPGPEGMLWVYIDDPGVSGHEGFTGEMSKYETTNAQYAQYLNSAMADGLITIYNDDVYAAGDTSHTQRYFELYPGSSPYSQITYSDGTFSVRSREGYDMSDHPVVEVSWYGATAFCDYYSYRLPTGWQWQAVADSDGTYTYGCGATIDFTKANYGGNNPLGLSSPYTTPVGYYGTFGYGLCDMAGNVWEWTSTASGNAYLMCGGGFENSITYCEVSYRYSWSPFNTSHGNGFRACR